MGFLKKLFGLNRSKKIKTANKNLSLGEELIEAANDGDKGAIKRLLAKGADVNSLSSKDGRSALIISVFKSELNKRQINIFKMLLDHGADVNLQDNIGETALMWASIRGNEGIVKALLKKGANVDLQEKGGYTALTYALANRHVNVVRMLLKKATNVNFRTDGDATALIFASGLGLGGEVKILLEPNPKLTLGYQ